MLEDMELVKHHVGLRQNLRNRIQIGPVHIGTHGANRAPLMRVQIRGEQGRGGGLRTVLPHAHDLTAHHIRQDGPEALAFPALDLIETDVARPPCPAGAIPVGQEGLFGAPRFAPTDAVPHGRVAGRHRLAIQPDLLAQAARDPRFGIGKLDPLRPHPTVATDHAPLPIDQRHRVHRPRQVVPGAVARGADPAGPSPAAAAHVAPYPPPFQVQPESTVRGVVLPLEPHDPKARQTQDPGTLPSRSHVFSLLGCTSRENDTGRSDAKWDRVFSVQAAEPAAPPTAARAGGRVSPQIAVLKSTKSLFVEPPHAAHVQWYWTHFDYERVVSVADGGVYDARGVMGAWLARHADGRRYRFACVEFGTHPEVRVLAALRAENRAHHHAPAESSVHAVAKRELVECFCPRNPLWREKAIARGGEVVGQAMAAVGHLGSD